MSERERMQAKALEYARSQGWVAPGAQSFGSQVVAEACAKCEALERGQQVAQDALDAANAKLAELERRLATRAPHLRKRIEALETSLREVIAFAKSLEEVSFSEEQDAILLRAESLLPPGVS